MNDTRGVPKVRYTFFNQRSESKARERTDGRDGEKGLKVQHAKRSTR